LLKAKQEAEAKGYIFLANHDEIVERAKKEGKLRVLSSQQPVTIKAVVNGLRKKYPFIDVNAEEVAGVQVYQRMLQEMKSGLASSDVNYLGWDSYSEYLPHLKRFDILGMAEHGVLRLPPRMADPVHRHVVALQSNMQVVGYNKEVVPAERVPNTWEDFLKPEFKGRKFAVNVHPKVLPALVPVWGLEKVLDFARKLAAQNPIWFYGDSFALAQMATGEWGVVLGPNYTAVKRQQDKDARKVIHYKVVEPVPVRLTEAQAVLATAANPYAGLLWLEFQASPEGQKILDEVDSTASVLSPGSAHEQQTRGKKVSIVAWDHFEKTGEYAKKIVEASGFPRAEK
jgi:ABC-type Fe3+ transport system substrate-binding protein